MWENNDYTLMFHRNPFYQHEQAILARGGFDGCLPMSFLRNDGGLTARYECDGFLPLSSFRIERTEDVLFLMEKLLFVLHEAPEYLLCPERLFLRTETVFYNKEEDRVRIAYLPRPAGKTDHNSRVPPFYRELILFLAQMKQDVKDTNTDLIARFARQLYYNCPDTKRMLRSIGLLRRELDGISNGSGSRTSGAS